MQTLTYDLHCTLGLAEVLVALTNLLAAYKSGLRVTKLQEFLLSRDGIDLEKFSLSHGYKDTLEFLEAQMTELSIHYREDRLSSVIQLAAGCGDNAKPLSTSCHSSASKAQDQSLPLSASPTVENGVHKYRSVVQPPVLPSFDNPCITSHAKISSSRQLLCPGPAQPPKACQLNGPLPPDEVSPQVDVEVPKISSLIKDQPAKDLEELKRQVAHILARHPEGMSLFQFRAAYSATYQEHLPLGNASSAKQCLLKMPDVVQLKGCGVQTLLLPVSLAAPAAKSGQPASSAVEKTPTVPGHTLPPTTAMAEPQMALRPILSKAPEVPQQSPVSFLPPDHCREPSDQESCLLPRGQLPTTTNPWQEHQRARAKAEDISGQPDWSRVEKASVDLAISVPKASLVGAPESRLKPPAPNTAAMPTPQTPLSFLQVSELCRQMNSKECSSFSQPVPQKAPLPVYPIQEYVRTNPKPECNSFPPQSPVVSPTTPTSWDENLKPSSLDPKSTHLTNPWSLSHRAPATLASQPVSAGFQAWSQPVVYPPITFLSEMPAHPVTYPTPFVPTPVHPCQIQVPKSTLRSHPHAQKVTPKRPAQVMPPIHSTAQWTYIPAVPHSNIFQVPETSRTLPPSAVVFPAGWSPLSPPPRNTDASRSPKSQAVPQLACSNQDGLQGFSLPGANEKHPDTTLEGVTSKPLSPTYPRPYNNADPLKTSSSTLPISSLSLSSTKASLEPPYASSGIKKNSNSPLEPPAFLNQQQFTSTSTAPDTSDVRPAGSPPSLLDPTSSTHDQHLHPLSSITSNSDVHFSEPESFNDPQPYTSVSAVRTVSSTPSLSSPLCPVGSPSSPSRQPSSAGWKGGIDYGAPDRKNAMPTIFNQTGSPPGPLSRRQTLPNRSPPVTPPSRSFDKCVIL
ncbi:hypothetical protein JRQ81_005539 [Phrynocephalus forsythii]|uniref:HTH OST-type domain-containing protein n=1 Tax=Phrynocephalus forsythii TaxID=171643 RepID=A0A9Q0XGG1_9SAUR|nr:hypothetical protein JRQ81_005539 [Phrynocephalus forsythii]